MTTPQQATSSQELYHIRLATRQDLPHLTSIEQSAAELFRSVPALAWLADGDTMSPDLLSSLYEAQTLWVALTNHLNAKSNDVPIAFLAAYPVDKRFYIAELSVSAAHQRQGLARKLMAVAMEGAVARGYESASLTTDREVPWNGPFYAKMGFREVEAEEAGPEHVVRVKGEAEGGFEMGRRCVMVLELAKETPSDAIAIECSR